MRRLATALVLVVAAAGLGGCTTAASIAAEEMMSNIAGTECQLKRVLFFKPPCMPSEEAEAPASPVYCYRTIGAIECHETPRLGERTVEGRA